MRKAIGILCVMLLVTGVLAIAGCRKGLTLEKGKLLMVGHENPAFLWLEGKEPKGFSGELAVEIAKQLDLDLEVNIENFDDLFDSLKDDKSDIAMSAITITPEREKTLEFSDPYFESGQCILVPKGSDIKSEADLKGKVVGVLRGSTNQEEAEKIEGIKSIEKYGTHPDMLNALVGGKLDAVIIDTPLALFHAKETGQTEIAKDLTTGDLYGIALKKGNSALRDKIDEALKELKVDGTYDKLYRKYFGEKE